VCRGWFVPGLAVSRVPLQTLLPALLPVGEPDVGSPPHAD